MAIYIKFGYYMRKIILLLMMVLLASSIATSARAAPIPSEQPVVHTVLFWSNGCTFCSQVLTETLPPLQEKYASRLSILLVEVVTIEDIDNLYSLGSALGVPKEQVAVPFLLIDHTALVGANEIEDNLAGLVEKYLASGGLDYPELNRLDGMLSKGVAFKSFNPSVLLIEPQAVYNNDIGNALAWVIMVFMWIAVIVSIAMIVRAFNGRHMAEVKGWLKIGIPVLSVIGLGVSIYLTYIEFTQTRAICGPVGDCNAVQNSPYAKLFGVVPIGLVGMIGYIAILSSWYWQGFRKDAFSRIAGPVMFGMSVFGTLFSIYLTYLELYVIHAVCLWCLSSAAIMAALMLLSLPNITQWLAITDEDEQLAA